MDRKYLDDRRNSGMSKPSCYNFKSYFNRYVVPCIGRKTCDTISMKDLVRLKSYIAEHLKIKKISPRSINRYVSMVNAVFRWGVMHEYISYNPWEKYKTPKEMPQPPELLSMEGFSALMHCAEPHCSWALDVEFNTGCRPGRTELFKLKYSDVNWDDGKLLIRSTKTRPRVVHLRPDFLQRLRMKQKEAKTDYIVEYKGRPVGSLKRSIRTALKKAGIQKKVRFYDVRHMYGTYMEKNGADIFAVQCLMGHSSLSTTKRYLHHAEALKKDTLEKLPSLHYSIGKTEGKIVNLVPKRQARNAAVS